jgi:phage shock protein E
MRGKVLLKMRLTLLLAVYVPTFALWNCSREKFGAINPENAKAEMQSGATVLDVRTPSEFASGHIAGAKNISIDSADFLRVAHSLNKKATYVVHCSANVPKGRTDRAIEQLRSIGFQNLLSMTGGIAAWKEKGFPTE